MSSAGCLPPPGVGCSVLWVRDRSVNSARHYLLARIRKLKTCCCAMATAAPNPAPPSLRGLRLKRLAIKVVLLVGLGLAFGWAYDWAAPRFYRPETIPGFRLGVLHGALMPIALPTLLMGKDVPIYAVASTGRTYKLGYIAGINLCGLIFFGATFHRPRSANK